MFEVFLGGTQIWFGQGCATEARNPYPSLGVISTEKSTHFLVICLEIEVHFSQLLGVHMMDTWKFWKNRPTFRDIL